MALLEALVPGFLRKHTRRYAMNLGGGMFGVALLNPRTDLSDCWFALTHWSSAQLAPLLTAPETLWGSWGLEKRLKQLGNLEILLFHYWIAHFGAMHMASCGTSDEASIREALVNLADAAYTKFAGWLEPKGGFKNGEDLAIRPWNAQWKNSPPHEALRDICASMRQIAGLPSDPEFNYQRGVFAWAMMSTQLETLFKENLVFLRMVHHARDHYRG